MNNFSVANINSDMPRITDQVSRLGIAPSDGSAVFVLHGCSTTMTDNITAARLVVKHPIDK